VSLQAHIFAPLPDTFLHAQYRYDLLLTTQGRFTVASQQNLATGGGSNSADGINQLSDSLATSVAQTLHTASDDAQAAAPANEADLDATQVCNSVNDCPANFGCLPRKQNKNIGPWASSTTLTTASPEFPFCKSGPQGAAAFPNGLSSVKTIGFSREGACRTFIGWDTQGIFSQLQQTVRDSWGSATASATTCADAIVHAADIVSYLQLADLFRQLVWWEGSYPPVPSIQILRVRMRALLVAFVVGCGGIIQSATSDGGIGDSGDHDVRTDAGGDGGGWTKCSSPNGARVCRGPNQCPESDCLLCESAGAALGACSTSTNFEQLTGGCSSLYPCTDGRYCINLGVNYASASEDLARLFEANNASARLRYADLLDGTIPRHSADLPDTSWSKALRRTMSNLRPWRSVLWAISVASIQSLRSH
jgi:hypothetical protein